LNAFSAEIIDPEQCILKVGDQMLEVAHDLRAKQRGENVTIAIRPERINFAPADINTNLLAGTIKSVIFLGSIVRVFMACGENMLCMDIFNNPYLELPKTGEHVQIACPRDAVLVLDK
jgi:putative spermidine/putrescine transport system ATP-binding protein